MSKKRKKYNPALRQRELVSSVVSQFTLAGVTAIDNAVFLMGNNLQEVRISVSTAEMLNQHRHFWSIAGCVAGRFKNGKVWVKVAYWDSTIPAYADEISPMVTTVLDEFFDQQPKDTRLCKWWVAKPVRLHPFSAEELMKPAYWADVFGEFITLHEQELGLERGNCPPSPAGKDFTIDQFSEWWKKYHSLRSDITALWLEE